MLVSAAGRREGGEPVAEQPRPGVRRFLGVELGGAERAVLDRGDESGSVPGPRHQRRVAAPVQAFARVGGDAVGVDEVEALLGDAVAQDWSEQQAAANNMSHRPDFTSVYPKGWTTGSENVAWRTAGGDTGALIFDQWFNSPGHYKNMTDPNVNSIGIGFAQTSDGRWYATQNFAAYNVSNTTLTQTTSTTSNTTTTTTNTTTTTTKSNTARTLSPSRRARRRPSSLEECRAFGLLN